MYTASTLLYSLSVPSRWTDVTKISLSLSRTDTKERWHFTVSEEQCETCPLWTTRRRVRSLWLVTPVSCKLPYPNGMFANQSRSPRLLYKPHGVERLSSHTVWTVQTEIQNNRQESQQWQLVFIATREHIHSFSLVNMSLKRQNNVRFINKLMDSVKCWRMRQTETPAL